MEKIIIKNIKVDFNEAFLIKNLCIKKDSEDYEVFLNMLNEAKKFANPKVVYKASFIEKIGTDFVIIDGIKFKSKILTKNVKGIHRVFPYIATCGLELETYFEKETDMLKMYWGDQIKQSLLGPLLQQLNNNITKILGTDKFSKMNPGSINDWPLSEQKNIFDLLDGGAEEIGVKLTDSMLMIPSKSVSGIVFQNDSGYVNCKLCPRENCSGRSTEYDSKLFNELLGK